LLKSVRPEVAVEEVEVGLALRWCRWPKFGEAARDGKEEEGVDIDMPPLPPLPPLPTVSCDGLAQALFFSKGL